MEINKIIINKILGLSLGLSLIVIISGGFFIAMGPPEMLEGFFKSERLEEVTFETLETDPKKDAFLVCPEDFCMGSKVDLISPRFSQTTNQLRKTLLDYIDNNETLSTQSFDMATQQFTFLAHNQSKPFPDVITVRFIDLYGLYSTVAIYGRTEIGKVKSGANKKRAERWLKLLSKNE